MRKIIKFRCSFLQDGKFITTKWRKMSEANFKEWFKRKSPRVSTVNVHILIASELTDCSVLIDKWSWVRFGDIPSFDEEIRRLSKKMPCWYLLTKNGAWVNQHERPKEPVE